MSIRSVHEDDAILLAGGADQFGRFYERHEDFVLSFFLSRCHNAELAAELTAETFARALAGRGAFDSSLGEPRGWLYGIARNVLSESLAQGQVQDRARCELRLERLGLDDQAIARIEKPTNDVALAELHGLPEDQRLAARAHDAHPKQPR